MTGFWSELPTRRAAHIVGADADAVAQTLDPLPISAPAVAVYYPHAQPVMSKVVDAVLGELEMAAIELFPSWLPAAAGIDGQSGLAVSAVRSLAKEIAAASEHFGPFLADLAVGALRRRLGGLAQYPAETRALGLMRVIKTSYDRPSAAILVPVPDLFPIECQRSLIAASDWIAQHGDVGVWLAGPLDKHERILSTSVELPEYLRTLADSGMPSILKAPVGPVIIYPPMAGKPHPGSQIEQRLEAALSKKIWADGRVWNQSYSPHPLVNAVRLDLWWRDERCVVEIDGPEHRSKWKFAEDHRRDVMLHNDGFTVLRFTNAQVMNELDFVLAAIEQFIQTRRKSQGELAKHG